MECPEWLKMRGGSLRQGRGIWFVVFGDEPQYSLAVVPANGKFGCIVRQTINGKRLGRGSIYPTEDEACRAGLEELGRTLGWI